MRKISPSNRINLLVRKIKTRGATRSQSRTSNRAYICPSVQLQCVCYLDIPGVLDLRLLAVSQYIEHSEIYIGLSTLSKYTRVYEGTPWVHQEYNISRVQDIRILGYTRVHQEYNISRVQDIRILGYTMGTPGIQHIQGSRYKNIRIYQGFNVSQGRYKIQAQVI